MEVGVEVEAMVDLGLVEEELEVEIEIEVEVVDSRARDEILVDEVVAVDVVDSKARDEILVEEVVALDDAATAGDEDTATWLPPPTPAAFEQELPVHFW